MSLTDVTLCATSRSGLGHVARIHHIARAMRRSRRFGTIHLLSNADIPPDVFRPTDERRPLFDKIQVADKKHFASIIAQSQAQVAVIDTAVVPDIGTLALPIVLILRETRDDRLQQFVPAPRRHWDLIIVPNPEDHWSPDSRLLPAQCTQHVGWIHEAAEPKTASRDISDPSRILLCAGGGGNADWHAWEPPIRQLIDGIRQQLSRPLHVTQLLGPRAHPCARFDWCDETVSSTAALEPLMEEHDLVITATGYNTVLELARCTTPALLIPLERTFDDQHQRASTWAPALGRRFDPDNISQAIEWSVDLLQHTKRRQRYELGVSGATNAATLIHHIAQHPMESAC